MQFEEALKHLRESPLVIAKRPNWTGFLKVFTLPGEKLPSLVYIEEDDPDRYEFADLNTYDLMSEDWVVL